MFRNAKTQITQLIRYIISLTITLLIIAIILSKYVNPFEKPWLSTHA